MLKQTPVHERHNPDLLQMLPVDCRRVVEVGSSSGALARAYKERNPQCHYTGIEFDAGYAELSGRYCDRVIVASIEEMEDASFNALLPVDCWVFGDTLEHLRDPWGLLRRIRERSTAETSIVACIPNTQHWSLQVRLNCGDWRYEDSGLLDRTHLRFFTRVTILELFHTTGFRIVASMPRIFDQPPPAVAQAICRLATASGMSAEQALQDALPLQHVLRAVPAF